MTAAIETGYAPINGLDLYYEISGEGDPLILLPARRVRATAMFGAILPALAMAGDKNVGGGGADIAQQAPRAGLIDEISVERVPILLGSGISFFGELGVGPIKLEQIGNVEGTGVTHLRFRVVK